MADECQSFLDNVVAHSGAFERRVIVAWLLGLVAKLGGPYGFDGKLIDGL